MKKLILFLLLLVPGGVFSQNQNTSARTDISMIEQKAHAAMFRSVNTGAANTYDINYHRCEWQVDPSVRYIKGSITTYFKPRTSGFTSMQFDLDTIFTIDSISYHNINLSFTQLPPAVLQISLPSVIPPNTLDSITVNYKGIPPNSGFGSFEQTTHGSSSPIIWTLSEPFGAQDWWPCKQDLNDKVDSVDIIVTTPQINRVASNGVLLSEALTGSDKMYHWKTRHPIAAYLIAIAVTDYAAYSDFVPLSSSDSLEVLNYVYPEHLTDAQQKTPDIINVIKLFDSLTITYPFADEKYGHAEFSWGGGMEHQTMSFVGGFDHGLLAHECAHQWFGDHVTCGSWQDVWLNEGFATYFEGLTEERLFPATWQSWKHDKINSITSQPGGSVLCDDTTSVSRIFDGRLSYNKGAYLLHMLRWKLGDSIFFAALKNYLTTSGISRGYAKTPDLKAKFESVSGQDLTHFFDQWYYGQGYPSYQVVVAQTGNTLSTTINQTQSHSAVTFFEMPVPIKFIGESQDTTLVFNNSYSGQQFTSSVNFPIVAAEFDPELRILSAGNTIIGVKDQLANSEVFVYPNPATSLVSIMIQIQNRTELNAEIFDVSGRKVQSETFTVNSGKSTNSIDISHLSTGIYELKISCQEFTTTQTLIKK